MTDPTFTSTETAPDQLLAGEFPRVTRTVTIKESAALERGAVLGRITDEGADEGKYLLSAAAATDGSEDPYAVLVRDVDASEGDVEAAVYLAGEFNEDVLSFGAGHDADSVREALRALSIFLATTVDR